MQLLLYSVFVVHGYLFVSLMNNLANFSIKFSKMAQFVRFVAHSLRRNLVPTSRRGGVRLAAGAGISSLLSYKVESDLAKPEASLKLENIHQEWSHKYLLQQSRFVIFTMISL